MTRVPAPVETTGPMWVVPVETTGPMRAVTAETTGPLRVIPVETTGPMRAVEAETTGPIRVVPAETTGPIRVVPAQRTAPDIAPDIAPCTPATGVPHPRAAVLGCEVVTVGCAPLLTASMPADGGTATLTEHREVHGELRRIRRGELTELVAAARIRGRGGAGFPLARKLRAASESQRASDVVVNGAESEPASLKDRTLLTRAPHLVLDGAQLIADEICARAITVWVHDPVAAETVGHALGERADRVPVTVVRAPDGYLPGESSAALAHLGGGAAKPAFALRPAAEQGPQGRPVVVSNAESAAAVAGLVAHGLQRHHATGTPDEPGTRLLTVHRGPGEPVLVEAATGIPVAGALTAVGAPVADVRAVLVGGYFGRWLPPDDALAAPLSHAGLAAVGGVLGAGIVLAPAGAACLLGEVAAVVDHLAAQNAGQCGPCVQGLPALARTLDAIVTNESGLDHVQRVHDLAAAVTGRGACRHPDGVAMFAASAVAVLVDEVAAHLDGRCGLPNRGWLPLREEER